MVSLSRYSVAHRLRIGRETLNHLFAFALEQSMYVAGRCSDKLEPIHHRIYCQRSGTSAHTQAVAKYVRYYIDIQSTELGNFPPVESAAKIMRQIIYSNAGSLSASMKT